MHCDVFGLLLIECVYGTVTGDNHTRRMINDHEPFSAGVAGCCQARKAAGQAAQRAKAEAEKEQQEVGRVGWVQIQLQEFSCILHQLLQRCAM